MMKFQKTFLQWEEAVLWIDKNPPPKLCDYIIERGLGGRYVVYLVD